MKKILFLLACVLTFSTLSAQYKTEVTVTDLHDSNLQGNIQQTLTGLLTEFNNANARDMSLDLSKFNIDAPTKKTIEMLWRNSHFRCEETEVVEPALKLYTGDEYEIRNIPLIFTNLNNEYHEVAITFDLSGKITSFHISLPQNIYADIMRTNNEVTDLRRRQIVLDYVEHFRTAYNTKDIDFMEKVFSDDALIIVGRVIMVQRELMPAIPKAVSQRFAPCISKQCAYLCRFSRCQGNATSSQARLVRCTIETKLFVRQIQRYRLFVFAVGFHGRGRASTNSRARLAARQNQGQTD